MTSLPVEQGATKDRLQVAAIDFGTTYSGYAFSFRSDFLSDPLKITTNQWNSGSGKLLSHKTSSCILFDPSQRFHSFGFEAEDKYAELAADEQHYTWFFFSRFKMVLYENKGLSRKMQLKDVKGMEMPAMTVFAECIRFLKEHLLDTCSMRMYGLQEDEIHWVLTVPAIWDDSAKQFMREAAVNGGIDSNKLSLALEPEAASMYCRHLPVTRAKGADEITCFRPGTRYLVLDAGGGTIDITVHETQADHSVREVYKANGGPWGGTSIDRAFFDFLEVIIGPGPMEGFRRDRQEDYLDVCRDFEIKKKSFGPDMDQRVTFKIPISIHDIFFELEGTDLRQRVTEKEDLRDQITFTGDKLRVKAENVKLLFKDAMDNIISHLRDVFSKREVSGTNTILMVGGFSESPMLQAAVQDAFRDKKVIIPAEAGLAVLKGAVIFGHNPQVIQARMARFTYGVKIMQDFIEGHHPERKKKLIDGIFKCDDVFHKHVEEGQQVDVGMRFEKRKYYPVSRNAMMVNLGVYTSKRKDPQYVDERGCSFLGNLGVDVSHISKYKDREILVQMIYGDTELGVEAELVKTGEMLSANFDFLG